MQRFGEEVHLDDDEARGGTTPNIVRYVLVISLILAILAMSSVWMWRAYHDSPPRGQAVTAEQHALGT